MSPPTLLQVLRTEPDKSFDRGLICASIMGIGTSVPDTSYTQEEFQKLFGVENRVVKRLIAAGHIHKRHLYLPEIDPASGIFREETQDQLSRKFITGVKDIGVKSAVRALASAGLAGTDIDYLVCVTSSGFAVPGVSSLISRALGMREDLHRSDVVGMGCNAGMSALYPTSSWAKANPGKIALLLCCEINSANYVRDETLRTGIVNSLFGDGAAAIVIGSGIKNRLSACPPETGPASGPKLEVLLDLVDFRSLTLPEYWDAMRFDWDADKQKWSFFLSKEIPFVIGSNVHRPVTALLEKNGLKKENIKHWILHTGGGAVIDGARRSLELSEHDVRHTRTVLRDFGNLSSGSFLFSLERLLREKKPQEGDLCVVIAMGPGSTIEAGLSVFRSPF